MRLPSLLSITGFIILIAGTYCPMLRPFHLFNWNVYQMNQPFGILLMLVGVIGVVASALGQTRIMRLAALISAGLVVLLFIAAILKVHTSFSFIPFKGLNAFLTRQIKFKWGWWVLFAGPFIAVLASVVSKKPTTFPSK